MSSLLLTDIHEILAEHDFDRIHLSSLLIKLLELEDRPWGEYRYGKPLIPYHFYV